MTIRTFIGVAAVWVTVASGAQGQLTIPTFLTSRTASDTVREITAAEAAHHLRFRTYQLDADVASSQDYYPQDSMLKAVSASAAMWLAELQKRPIKGFQLDPSGYVSVGAQNEVVANAQIAERLATRGLSTLDRAFTYVTAVSAFANWRYPERFPTAEAYLKQLEAMGDSAAVWEYVAHSAMIDAYHMVGASLDVVRHGERAIALIGIMPFHNRLMLLSPAGSGLYTKVVEALAGLPKGRDRITALNIKMEASTKLSTTLIALDSAFIQMGRGYEEAYRAFLRSAMLLGTVGQPLVANYWINRGLARDSAIVRLDDGKVRVVTISGYG